MTHPATAAVAPQQELGRFVATRISGIQQAYLGHHGGQAGQASAQLATLRRLDMTDPAGDPAVYPLVFDQMPQALVGRGDGVSWGEFATAAALHLYAVHQQGRSAPMHVAGARFGAATRHLAQLRGTGSDLSPGVVSRFSMLLRSGSDQMRLVHLRSLVTMLRQANLPLDYGRLAGDLFDLANPDREPVVHLRWARDFHVPVRRDQTPADPANPS